MEYLAIAIGILSLLATGAVWSLVNQLERRLRTAEKALSERPAQIPIPLPDPDALHPLEGLRIALAISQDHPHAPFVNLLKELLLKEDVAEAATTDAVFDPATMDILIQGRITCNGYAEIYYDADLTCTSLRGPVCTLIEKPPHGDRPGNLGIELVARLRAELAKSVERTERKQAILELRQGAN